MAQIKVEHDLLWNNFQQRPLLLTHSRSKNISSTMKSENAILPAFKRIRDAIVNFESRLINFSLLSCAGGREWCRPVQLSIPFKTRKFRWIELWSNGFCALVAVARECVNLQSLIPSLARPIERVSCLYPNIYRILENHISFDSFRNKRWQSRSFPHVKLCRRRHHACDCQLFILIIYQSSARGDYISKLLESM